MAKIKRTREWLILISSLLIMIGGIYLLSVKSVFSAASDDSTDITTLPAPQIKIMKCYGPVSVYGAINDYEWGLCSPGSQSFYTTSTCPSGMVAVGMSHSATWSSAGVNCATRCASVDLPQSNCKWE